MIIRGTDLKIDTKAGIGTALEIARTIALEIIKITVLRIIKITALGISITIRTVCGIILKIIIIIETILGIIGPIYPGIRILLNNTIGSIL